MEDPEIITATEASRSFSDLLHRVCYGGESFVIKKGNRMMARIMPVDVTGPMQAEEKTAAPAEIPEVSIENEEAQLAGLSEDEAEYFKTVLAQIRKVSA